MEIRAYSEDYVEQAMRVLGDMLDFAVNTCEMDPEDIFTKFITSGISDQFGKGNPKYVVGMTGCELAKEVVRKTGQSIDHIDDMMYTDKSPEYWVGWALAYYQWYSGQSFARIYKAVPIQVVLGMYQTLHEADLNKFIKIMNDKVKGFYPETNLKRLRINLGYSQRELAELSGVSLRQIQLFEQRQRDINKAHVETVMRLARALGVPIDVLIE